MVSDVRQSFTLVRYCSYFTFILSSALSFIALPMSEITTSRGCFQTLQLSLTRIKSNIISKDFTPTAAVVSNWYLCPDKIFECSKYFLRVKLFLKMLSIGGFLVN